MPITDEDKESYSPKKTERENKNKKYAKDRKILSVIVEEESVPEQE